MATELEELLAFLSFPSSQVKKAAVDIVRDYTGSDDGIRMLGKYQGVVISSLLLCLAENKEISEPAAQALVNLSPNAEFAKKMVDMRVVKTVMDYLYRQGCDVTSLLVMLLLNLTQLDSGIDELLQLRDEKMQGLHLMKLVRSFCTTSGDRNGDPFEHVASILVNISKKEEGRKILLDSKRGLLKQIVRQFDSTNPLRQKGVSGTIRNCCFDAENHLQSFLLISEFLWPALLIPVAGNKIYSKQDTDKMPMELASVLSIEREPVTDPDVRVHALEAIYLLVLQDAGRKAFWSVNGPRILQVGYEDEEHPKAVEAYEQIGSLLIQESGSIDSPEEAQ